MSSVLGNFTKCTNAVMYTKNVGGGELLPKLLQKLQKSLRSHCAERSQGWRSHCSVICEAIPFDFFTDSGNVNPDQKKLLAIRHSITLGASGFSYAYFRFGQVFMVTRGRLHNISSQTSHSRKNLCHLGLHFALLS